MTIRPFRLRWAAVAVAAALVLPVPGGLARPAPASADTVTAVSGVKVDFAAAVPTEATLRLGGVDIDLPVYFCGVSGLSHRAFVALANGVNTRPTGERVDLLGNARGVQAWSFLPPADLEAGSAITVTAPASTGTGGTTLPPTAYPLAGSGFSEVTQNVLARVQVSASPLSPQQGEGTTVAVELPEQLRTQGVRVSVVTLDPFTGEVGNRMTATQSTVDEDLFSVRVPSPGAKQRFFGAELTLGGVTVTALRTVRVSFDGAGPVASNDRCAGYVDYRGAAPTFPGGLSVLPYLVGVGNDIGDAPQVLYPAEGRVGPDRATGVSSVQITVPTALAARETDGGARRIWVYAVNTVSPPAGVYPGEAWSVSTSAAPTVVRPAKGLTFTSLTTDGASSSVTSASGPCGSVPVPCAEVDDVTGAPVVVTTRDRRANPVKDVPVRLSEVLGTTLPHVRLDAAGDTTEGAQKTGASGEAAWTAVNSCAETVRLRGTDKDGQVLGDVVEPLRLTFVAGPPVPPSVVADVADCGRTPSRSSVVTGSAGDVREGGLVLVPGDGVTTVPVEVTLGDRFGNAVTGAGVQLTGTGATATPRGAQPTGCLVTEACTDEQGSASLSVSGTADRTQRDVSLRVLAGKVPVLFPELATDTVRVRFLPVDLTRSSVTAPADGATAVADGRPSAAVTVRLVDRLDRPMQAQPLQVSSSDAVLECSPCVTDERGLASVVVGRTTPGTSTVVVRLARTGEIVGTTDLTFVSGGLSLQVDRPTLLADGTDAVVLSGRLTSPGGAPAAGRAVTLSVLDGAEPPRTVTTDPDGAFGSRFASADPGSVLVVATSTDFSDAPSCPGRYTEEDGCEVRSRVVEIVARAAPQDASFTVAPAGVPADNRTTATARGLVVDAGGVEVPGVLVRLAVSPESDVPASALTTTPAEGTATGASGTATFTLRGGAAGVARFQPEYRTGDQWRPFGRTFDLVLRQTQAGASVLTVGPAAGVGEGEVLVTVLMQTGCDPGTTTGPSCTVLPGTPVAVTTSSPTARVRSVDGSGGVTDGAGVARFALTNTKVEAVTIFAHDLDRGVRLGPATASFLPGRQQRSTVRIDPGTVPVNGLATVTVTLLDERDQPLPFRAIQLRASSATTSVEAVGGAVTDERGVQTFTVSDSRAGNVTFTATDLSTGIVLAARPVLTVVDDQTSRSTLRSNLVSTPAGGSGATLTATMLDGAGRPLADRQVELLGASPSTTVRPLLTGGRTDSTGVVQFQVASTALETLVLSARDVGNGLVVQQTATVRYVAHESNQSVVTGVASVPAGGPTGTVEVLLIDAGGAPLPGNSVSLTTDSATAVVSPATATAGPDGRARFTVSNPVVEPVVYTALDRTTGVTVLDTTRVVFTPDEANQSTATASPPDQKVGRDIVVTVTLRDAAGQPLVGHRVELTPGTPRATVAYPRPPSKNVPVQTTTNSSGVITFLLRDRDPGVLRVGVTDLTTGVRLYQPLTVSFYG